MPAQPYDIDGQTELFNGEEFWREPAFVPLPVEELEPDSMQQLGWANLDQGVIAHAEFDFRMARLGAAYSRPNADPGGGSASDTIVTFKGRTITVQVKSARLNAKGRAQFDLGPRDGSRAGGRDTRRRMGYIGRADFFALAVFNDIAAITDWYLIPAAKLRKRVSLTVTPGKRNKRRRKDWLEPEQFRDAWERLLDVSSTVPVGSRMSSTVPVGSPRNA